MDKNIHIEDCKDESVPHLPMGQLFYLLHSNGFNVKPDDYIEMIKITERFGSADIDETSKWLCPIIATSEAEQSRFYNVIEQYKKIESFQACQTPVKEEKNSNWIKIPVSLFFVAILLLSGYLFVKKKTFSPPEINRQRTAKKGQPLVLDASNLLRDRPEDTSHIKFRWQFNDGTTQNGLRVLHIFKDTGDFLIRREFSSSTIALKKNADSLFVHVCNDIPKITINIPGAAITINKPVTITATVDANAGTVAYYQWTISDSVFTTADPIINNYIFTKEGDNPVECKAVVGNVSSPCTGTDNEIIQVQNNQLRYSTNFSSAKHQLYAGRNKLKWWASLILLLPAVAGLIYSFVKKKGNPPVGNESKPVSAIISKGPFDIPFEQNDTKFIQPEIDLRRTLVQMKYKAEEETLALSINGTIQSIIKSGGSPQLVFAPVILQQQYLILIDRSNPKSMLTHFFGYFAKSIAEDNIPVTVFYYDKNFSCFNDQFPGGLSLQKLANGWQNATLIIFGKANELVYNVYPLIEEHFLKELNRWQNKAIITPLPLKDWAEKEKVLQDYIILLPADVKALQKLIPALREKIKLNKNLLEITEEEQYSIVDTDFRDANELQIYLGKDEVLFQWLCAICIYPRLKWEVLVEIGKAILDKYGQPESLNYSNLLKLCRISWMQQGIFPQSTRLELLKLLKTDNELCARERLLHMLNYSTIIFGGNEYFFEEEKQRQITTNQFILQASGNNLYGQYADSKEAFKKLWNNDALLDMPVKKYLDKKSNDNWQTPVSDGKNSVGLSAYFNLQNITLNKKIKDNKILTAAASLLLIILWAYVNFGGGAQKFGPIILQGVVNAPASVTIEMKILKDFSNCGDSLKKSFDQLNGYLEIDNKKFPLNYNQQTSIGLFNVPYKNLVTGSGRIMFSWDINKTVLAPLNFQNSGLSDSITIGCLDGTKIKRQLLYIRYNDETGYNAIANNLDNALYKYSLSADQSDFKDSSRIVYYETNQKAKADSIVSIVKQALNINVREDFVEEIRTPPASPILFLNTASAAANQADTTDSRSGDDYHSMGDQSFQDKQYEAAIASYKRAVAVNPKDELAFYQIGISYELLGASYDQDAIDAYTSAIVLNPKYVDAIYRRASVRYELKRYAAAIKDFDRVIELNTAKTNSKYNYSVYYRGKSNYFLNNISSACEDFKRASDAGLAAAKKDYGAYCTIQNNNSNAPGKSPNAAQDNSQAVPQKETDLFDIDFTEKDAPNSIVMQVIEQYSKKLIAQPQAKIKLTTSYNTENEKKWVTNYMNEIISLFEKNGANAKTQIIQQINFKPPIIQKDQSATKMTMHFTGISLDKIQNTSKY
jgi:TPR repeat